MSKALAGYACIRCGRASPLQLVLDSRGCLDCQSDAPANLRVAYSHETRAGWDFAATQGGPQNLWRYEAMLPVAARDAVSLGEGMTPLLAAPAMGKRLGVGRLLLKDETRNPTWSYKDRLSTVAISAARQMGAKIVATSSSGNAGASLAAYAARAGLPCVMVTYAHSAGPILAQARKYGAMVLPLASKSARWPLLADAVDRLGWFVTSPFRAPVVGSHPIGLEGYKTLAYEVAQQMDGDVPDWVVMPVCYGDALFGMWQGFLDLHERGVIARLPKMAAAEVFGSLRAALAVGGDLVPEVDAEFDTLAVSIGAAQGAFQALQVLRQSGGTAVAIGNDGLIRLQEEFAASEGIFAELASVTPLAAIARLRAGGVIEPAETVLAVVTASGLKDLDRSLSEARPLPATGGSLDNALDYLEEHYGFGTSPDERKKIVTSAG
ncbi:MULTISPECIES: pyridoxal-phosphate dependent enzyme [Rhodomicrobium]|uniref:pyridoxal-phosphate dependent enzyme n=1 Tax=Rhodomicrobium TaxID=1068 RepID=UPI000B4A9535|nr:MULTISPECIES: pyridoxal-phosphate dependent enzyme [Rhodomicrobium]